MCCSQYFEHDDPELYMTKVCYIEDNDVDDMELVFAEDEYKHGQLDRVCVHEQNSSLFWNFQEPQILNFMDGRGREQKYSIFSQCAFKILLSHS